MELSEEEKKAIERLTFYRDQIKEELYPRIDYEEEKAIGIVLNLLEKLQKEIEIWVETENDYEHELARKDEEIEEMREELEIQKRLIIEQIKRFCELYKPKEGIGEGGLDELAEKILSFSKDYISKDKIREIIKHYNNELEHIKNGEEFENEKPMYYWGKVALEDLLEE